MAYPITVLSRPRAIQGAQPPAFSGFALLRTKARLQRDLRYAGNTSGTVKANNRVFYKTSASSPEVPFPGALVRLHRYFGGDCVWQGLSDSAGFYWPTGLEVGFEYYPVAIDLTRVHQVVAAGPVIAE